jgi:hypothetical protein
MTKVPGILSRHFRATCALVLLAVISAPAANAAVVLTEGTVLSSGRQTWTAGFTVAGPGSLAVHVDDLGVEQTIIDRLSALSFSVTSSTGVLASRANEGDLTLGITGPGLYFVNIAADSSASTYKLGLLSWSAVFTPTVETVPLPAGLWLIASAAGWIAAQRRRVTARLFRHEAPALAA